MNSSVNQLARQLLGIWKQLGINQRLSLVLAAGVVVAGLIGLVAWNSGADYALLYGKLPEGEAAKVVAALDEAKVPYRFSSGSGTILVPSDKVHQMRMQLASKGIPRGEGVGFEIFDKPNFGISDFIQRANYLRAVQGELARTISQVENVEAARVMIVMPENRLLVDQQKKSTASVFVRVRGMAQLPPQTVNAIRFLVANSVEGLQANHVTVVDNLGNVLSENSESDSILGLTTTQLSARKSLEQYLGRKAEDMLAMVLGPGQAVVRVAAEINFDTNTKTEEKYDPDVQATRISTINDEDTESTSPLGGGLVGVSTNASTDTNMLAMASSSLNRTKKKIVNNQYELNKTTSSVIQAAGGLRKVSAAVFINAASEGTGAARKVTPRPEAELKKLVLIVQSALGIPETNSITLVEMPFNDQPTLEVAQQLQQQERKDFWLGLAGKTLYPAAAVGILFVFWRLLKRAPGDVIPLGVPVGQLTNGNGAAKDNVPVVTVEVLNQLIRENPNNMTQAIRAWMGRSPGASN